MSPNSPIKTSDSTSALSISVHTLITKQMHFKVHACYTGDLSLSISGLERVEQERSSEKSLGLQREFLNLIKASASLLPDSPADPSKRPRERETGTQSRCDFCAVRNVCVCGERNTGASFASVWQRAIELGNVRFFLADGTMCAVVRWRLIPVTGAGLDTAQVDVKKLWSRKRWVWALSTTSELKGHFCYLHNLPWFTMVKV